MPSPLAHGVTGYVLSKFFPLKKLKFYLFYGVFVAISPDFDFIPQWITGQNFHRGLTHSLIFAFGFSLIVAGLISYWRKYSYKLIFLSTLIIYNSHLFLDMFSSESRGIKLLLPFSNDFFRASFSIFPPFDYTLGLFHPSYLVFLVVELAYSLLILTALRIFKYGRSQESGDRS